jgi:hypothetical protein
MEVRPSNWTLFQALMQSTFWLAYQDAPSVHASIAKPVPCGTRFYNEAWMGRFPRPRHWEGSRVVHTPGPMTYQVDVMAGLKENTVGLDLYELKNDVYGVLGQTVPNLASNAKQDKDWELRDLIEGLGAQTGAAQLGTDQLYHWGGPNSGSGNTTGHPIDFYDPSAGYYPNDYGANGTTINGILVGGALTANAFATVRADMRNRKAETGEPMGIVPDLLMVATQNEYVSDTILQAVFLGLSQIGTMGGGDAPTAGSLNPANSPMVGASSNLLRGKCQQLTWEALYANPAAWCLLHTRGPVKPFQIVTNEEYALTVRSSPTDPIVWDTHTVQMGIVGVFQPTWAPPFLSSRSGI